MPRIVDAATQRRDIRRAAQRVFSRRGVKGTGHGRTYEFVDRELGYIVPAKVLALACVDLLIDGAAKAKEIIGSFEPSIPSGEYTKFMRKLVS